jgi:hypothetical protein
MLQSLSTFLMLAFGMIGAGLSLALLLLLPTNEAPTAYSRLIVEPVPNIILVAAGGFVIGAFVAAAWSLIWRFISPPA